MRTGRSSSCTAAKEVLIRQFISHCTQPSLITISPNKTRVGHHQSRFFQKLICSMPERKRAIDSSYKSDILLIDILLIKAFKLGNGSSTGVKCLIQWPQSLMQPIAGSTPREFGPY
ncbi:hypothetical protein GOODEAATRI_028481 [Goodea atripinnis]|uniref:Uncharacterized protein n=1 Tax=Goodea atripinnis TaxID=208336 RepID=A0ABV0P8I0_9TELE